MLHDSETSANKNTTAGSDGMFQRVKFIARGANARVLRSLRAYIDAHPVYSKDITLLGLCTKLVRAQEEADLLFSRSVVMTLVRGELLRLNPACDMATIAAYVTCGDTTAQGTKSVVWLRNHSEGYLRAPLRIGDIVGVQMKDGTEVIFDQPIAAHWA